MPWRRAPGLATCQFTATSKIVRFGGSTTNVGFDFYNLVNANTGIAVNQVYDVVSNGANWLRPTSVPCWREGGAVLAGGRGRIRGIPSTKRAKRH
jgi:hypothetical protein